ncbi:hypothetical protein CLU96_0487 [Chryseobacterium sp. 52]|nr:hypothetical protein CLU96_0487 [Chryseobacterium sp. 52]
MEISSKYKGGLKPASIELFEGRFQNKGMDELWFFA